MTRTETTIPQPATLVAYASLGVLLTLGFGVGCETNEGGGATSSTDEASESSSDETSESGAGGSEDEATAESKGDGGSAGEFSVSTTAFADGERIPTEYTCSGEGKSPPLEWSGVPAGTKSFVVLCEDPDAPNGVFKHWGAFDISGDRTSLPAGIPGKAQTEGLRQSKNDFGDVGYGPPCPPPGDGSHRYRFEVWALETSSLDLGDVPSYETTKEAARKHRIAGTTVTGTFSRE